MPNPKSDIIRKLENDILPLQGYKTALGKSAVHVNLGPINDAFPNSHFPVGAIHEFVCSDMEKQTAASGFISTIISSLMNDGGVALWISSSRTIFPSALKSFGIDPSSIIFIDLKNQKEVAWAVDEAVKLNGLAAVVGEMQEIDFSISRRLQLAVEQSQVTGFLLNKKNTMAGSNACLTRWKISSLPSVLDDDLPGVGFPCWKVDLLKVRNGRPGSWELAWMNGQFTALNMEPVVISDLHQKTG
ncbi:MAG TPA: Error-prone repair protein ImuA [Niastella sp.]